ncbi:DinB family protein [Telluribacter sp.]|jgi:hypothetical protein|uniref:DinB family protein n=1 Tax=Telluribacter sp. TaxID=1978767 RepID=UPI002E1657DC|nr:DinB family protein [Telluribacter sp.]
MTPIPHLIVAIETARTDFLSELSSVSLGHEHRKPDPATWSTSEVTEHLVWAEQGGILMMWKAVQAHQQGQDWEGERVNQSLSIEEIVARTWRHEAGRPKEEAPASAVPRLGGPLAFWCAALYSCQTLLSALEKKLKEVPEPELEKIIYPHVIMGPLNIVQRLEFLRYHLDHHREQVRRIKEMMGLLY